MATCSQPNVHKLPHTVSAWAYTGYKCIEALPFISRVCVCVCACVCVWISMHTNVENTMCTVLCGGEPVVCCPVLSRWCDARSVPLTLILIHSLLMDRKPETSSLNPVLYCHARQTPSSIHHRPIRGERDSLNLLLGNVLLWVHSDSVPQPTPHNKKPIWSFSNHWEGHW